MTTKAARPVGGGRRGAAAGEEGADGVEPVEPVPAFEPGRPTEETTSPRSTSSSPTEPEGGDRSAQRSGRALTGLLAELLKGASASRLVWTRRRYGLDLDMREGEARAVAWRIAKIVQRRWEVRSDLDATDVAGAGGSVISWVEPVPSGQIAPGTALAAPGSTARRRPHERRAPQRRGTEPASFRFGNYS